jgi:hypothetical protein
MNIFISSRTGFGWKYLCFASAPVDRDEPHTVETRRYADSVVASQEKREVSADIGRHYPCEVANSRDAG